MRLKNSLIILFLFISRLSFGQIYFDFFYTNIPKAKFGNFSIAYSDGLGWIQTGNYTWPSECSNCSDYSRDSKLKKERLDSLVAKYNESGLKKIYAKQYVSNNNYFGVDLKTARPYITKTLYRLERNKPIPVLQIKMTFYERPNKKPGISNIEISDVQTMTVFDTKIIMASYKQKVKEDSIETPPTIQNQ